MTKPGPNDITQATVVSGPGYAHGSNPNKTSMMARHAPSYTGTDLLARHSSGYTCHPKKDSMALGGS